MITTQPVWSQCQYQYSAYEGLQLAFKTTFKTTFKTKRNDIGLGSHRTCSVTYRTWLAGMEGDIYKLHNLLLINAMTLITAMTLMTLMTCTPASCLLPTLLAHTHTHANTRTHTQQHTDTARRSWHARMSSARQGKRSETGRAFLQACQSKNSVGPKTTYGQKQRRAKNSVEPKLIKNSVSMIRVIIGPS